jgi:hypothetical protein
LPTFPEILEFLRADPDELRKFVDYINTKLLPDDSKPMTEAEALSALEWLAMGSSTIQ